MSSLTADEWPNFLSQLQNLEHPVDVGVYKRVMSTLLEYASSTDIAVSKLDLAVNDLLPALLEHYPNSDTVHDFVRTYVHRSRTRSFKDAAERVRELTRTRDDLADNVGKLNAEQQLHPVGGNSENQAKLAETRKSLLDTENALKSAIKGKAASRKERDLALAIDDFHTHPFERFLASIAAFHDSPRDINVRAAGCDLNLAPSTPQAPLQDTALRAPQGSLPPPYPAELLSEIAPPSAATKPESIKRRRSSRLSREALSGSGDHIAVYDEDDEVNEKHPKKKKQQRSCIPPLLRFKGACDNCREKGLSSQCHYTDGDYECSNCSGKDRCVYGGVNARGELKEPATRAPRILAIFNGHGFSFVKKGKGAFDPSDVVRTIRLIDAFWTTNPGFEVCDEEGLKAQLKGAIPPHSAPTRSPLNASYGSYAETAFYGVAVSTSEERRTRSATGRISKKKRAGPPGIPHRKVKGKHGLVFPVTPSHPKIVAEEHGPSNAVRIVNEAKKANAENGDSPSDNFELFAISSGTETPLPPAQHVSTVEGSLKADDPKTTKRDGSTESVHRDASLTLRYPSPAEDEGVPASLGDAASNAHDEVTSTSDHRCRSPSSVALDNYVAAGRERFNAVWGRIVSLRDELVDLAFREEAHTGRTFGTYEAETGDVVVQAAIRASSFGRVILTPPNLSDHAQEFIPVLARGEQMMVRRSESEVDE